MIVDLIIILFIISAFFRGREIGFIRQLLSTAGFFGGLFLGAVLQPHVIHLAGSRSGQALLSLTVTLGCALTLLIIFELVGAHLKHKLLPPRLNPYDNRLGSVIAIISLLFSVWLSAGIVQSLPLYSAQATLQRSHIIRFLNRQLPPAPDLVSSLGKLIDPNGFPQVFIGNEPAPRNSVKLPSLGEMQSAVDKIKNSVVKIEGQGCGGIVEGSGFVVGTNLVATNAHVIAGISHPYVQDSRGTHGASTIWFDPDLDFAVLQVQNLTGEPLKINATAAESGSAAAVLGYPGGGPFSAGPAAIIDSFRASGRNIYGRGHTDRDVYEIKADIIPGNSGGPLIAKDGSVIGVVFAESTAFDHVGYALTGEQVKADLAAASKSTQTVSTGRCTD